jgi:adenylate cyclase
MSGPSRWFAELKRRKVFRVAAVYGATGFVALQGADLVFPRLGLPDWTVTLVVALSLVGFPVALALAWAFDATPDGLRRTDRADRDELAAIMAQPRARRWTAGFAALVGLALLAGGAWFAVGPGDSRRGGAYDSIAVLPFVNLSGDPENDYFGDGLAEELLNALSGIEGLKVAARTSAFAFKGSNMDVRTIGDTLRVATVLEGSVRRSAERIRIAAQLIDARTGYRLWSETYDRPRADLFAVQDAIAAEIVRALSVRLTGTTRLEELHRGGTQDPEAYDLYLLGRQKWATRQVPLLREAVGHFEAAVARDSSFALAWSGLADAIDALAWRAADALPRVPEAKYAAQRAILLDSELAEAWASLGVLALDFDRDWTFAELALRRAIALKPAYAVAHGWLADVMRWSGRMHEALESAQRAVELDPFSTALDAHSGSLAALGRWSEARESLLRMRHHGFQESALMLVTSAREYGLGADSVARYAHDWAAFAGYPRPDEAAVIGRAMLDPAFRAQAAAVIGRMEVAGVNPRALADAAVALGDYESGLRLLQGALEQNEPTTINAGWKPIYDPVRTDPRFTRVLEALRVPNCDPQCRGQPVSRTGPT